MTIADLAARNAYRIRGRGRGRRVYLLTAGGNWREYPRIPDHGVPVTLTEVRALLERERADWAPGEWVEAFGR